jgi:FKBP-type peptidyl-prolyl cis-trans isomerase (trigger factor)
LLHNFRKIGKLASMTKITKLDKSRVEIEGSIPAEKFESFRKKALSNINEEVKIDGFRKGKVPEAMLIAKVGEMAILEEMAQLAISEAYPKIVVEEKIDAIGHPEVNITKIAAGNPLEFKIITAVVPETKLGDYKKIAKEENSKKVEVGEVTEKEIDDAILNIRRSRVDHSAHAHDSKMTPEEHDKLVDASLPEVTDEFVQSLGKFKDVAEFREKIKWMLAEEKVEKNRDKRRIALSDKLIETSTIDLPDLLVESEMRRIEAQFGDDIARMGVTLEDYVKHANKTIEDLRKDWRPHAEKKAKLQLILNKIATDEKITVDQKEIEAEVKHIVEHYKDADTERAAVYAETVLTNEKVFKFLEEVR